MKIAAMAILVSAGLLQACMQDARPPDPRAECEAMVRGKLLNPETAEFHDFTEVDAEAFKSVVIPLLEAEHDYPAGKIFVDDERKSIDSAAHLYRMRVRAEGQLGNKITTRAFCRQTSFCYCTLID